MIDQSEIKLDDLTPDFRELAEDIGMERALELVHLRGGEPIYVPSIKTIAKAARDRMIRSEYDGGTTFKLLARKYCLSVVTIRKIVGSSSSSKPCRVDKQLSLF